jgi:hypothetical protein
VPDGRPIAGAVVAGAFAVLVEHVLDAAVLLVGRALELSTVPADLKEAAVPARQVPLGLRILDEVVELHDPPTGLLPNDRLVHPRRDDGDFAGRRLAAFRDFKTVGQRLSAPCESE